MGDHRLRRHYMAGNVPWPGLAPMALLSVLAKNSELSEREAPEICLPFPSRTSKGYAGKV